MLKTTTLFLAVLLLSETLAYGGSFVDEDTLEVDWSLYHTTDVPSNHHHNLTFTLGN